MSCQKNDQDTVKCHTEHGIIVLIILGTIHIFGDRRLLVQVREMAGEPFTAMFDMSNITLLYVSCFQVGFLSRLFELADDL